MFELSMDIYEKWIDGECIGTDTRLEYAKAGIDKRDLQFVDEWFWDDEGQAWMRLYEDEATGHILPAWIEKLSAG